MLEALVSDVDGTLADTEASERCVAYNRTFREAGLNGQRSEEYSGRFLAFSAGREPVRYELAIRIQQNE